MLRSRGTQEEAGTLPAEARKAEPPAEKRLRQIAVIEGISYLLLLFIAVPLKHLLGLPIYVRVLGPIHGVLFILYVAAVFQAAPVLRWSAGQVALALFAGLLPWGPFVLESRLRKPQEAPTVRP